MEFAVPIYASYLGESLALSEQVEQFGDHLLALPGVYVCFVEHAGLLQHQTFLDAIEWRVLHCTQ